MESIHNVQCLNAKGENVKLADYKGKVLLIVNTASACGFTPQLADLQSLQEKFNADDFEVLAFPSNDFSGQEPLMGEDIVSFCTTQFNTTFTIFDKVKVKGNNKHPLFNLLSSKKRNGHTSVGPLWNFHKYLIDKKGYVRNYFFTTTSPLARRVVRKIDNLIQE